MGLDRSEPKARDFRRLYLPVLEVWLQGLDGGSAEQIGRNRWFEVYVYSLDFVRGIKGHQQFLTGILSVWPGADEEPVAGRQTASGEGLGGRVSISAYEFRERGLQWCDALGSELLDDTASFRTAPTALIAYDTAGGHQMLCQFVLIVQQEREQLKGSGAIVARFTIDLAGVLQPMVVKLERLAVRQGLLDIRFAEVFVQLNGIHARLQLFCPDGIRWSDRTGTADQKQAATEEQRADEGQEMMSGIFGGYRWLMHDFTSLGYFLKRRGKALP